LPLNGCKILVVEDECLIAEDLAALLRDAHAEVIGPAESLPQAMRLAADTELIDAAVLDINLRGVTVFPLADELTSRGIPIMFLTGYGENNIPQEYGQSPCCEKPMGVTHIVAQIKAILSPSIAAA
jgi:DNA-binding response OmpR family regulator